MRIFNFQFSIFKTTRSAESARQSFAKQSLDWFRISEKNGITLLLVIVILSALLSISLGIFTVVVNQIQISGEINSSYIAFYSADQGIERTLYRDRMIAPLCDPSFGPCVVNEISAALLSGGCYVMNMVKSPETTRITVVGQYRCGADASRISKRGFQVNY